MCLSPNHSSLCVLFQIGNDFNTFSNVNELIAQTSLEFLCASNIPGNEWNKMWLKLKFFSAPIIYLGKALDYNFWIDCRDILIRFFAITTVVMDGIGLRMFTHI